MNSKHYDVVIIGGGVSGCSSAYFLAASSDFNGSIVVIERDPTYSNAPSAKAAGGIRQQFSTPENIEIGLFGAHFVKNIADYLSVDDEAPEVDFKERGYLILASQEILPIVQENHATQRSLGADIVFLGQQELSKRFAWLDSSSLVGGYFGMQNEGWLDPYSLLQAYRRKARALGVDFINDEVVSIQQQDRQANGVTLKSGTRIDAGSIINAAGARDITALAAQVGIDLPIEPRKRCIFAFDCRESIGQTPHTIFPNGISTRAETNGYIGVAAPPSGWPDPVTDDTEVDYDLFDQYIWPELAQYIPAFEAIKLTNAYCCHYDFNTLDENLIIGLTPTFDNLYIITGFSGHGLQQSPAVGRAISELITFGEYRTLDLNRFGYQRVLSNTPLRETNCY